MALCLVVVATACAGLRSEEALAPTSSFELESARVSFVDDGDTIEVDIEGDRLTIRLIGVNTPEQGECYADVARSYLVDEINDEMVGISRYGTDQFGRTLADVWFGDDLVNLVLVERGLATALTTDREYPNNRLLLAAEDMAYTDGLGLWSPSACGPPGDVPEVEIDLATSQVNPDGPDDDRLDSEWITLVNRGTLTIDMSGWTLRDASSRNRLIFPSGVSLDPGGRLRIASGCSTVPAWCGSTSIWNNDGDLVLLLDTSGRVIDRARY